MSVTVTYQSGTPLIVTLSGETINVVAVPGSSYKHEGRFVANLAFTLPSGVASGKVNVAPPSGESMPAQSCVTLYRTNQANLYKSQWKMPNANTGTMTLSIPDPTSQSFTARMNIVGAGLMDITLQR